MVYSIFHIFMRYYTMNEIAYTICNKISFSNFSFYQKNYYTIYQFMLLAIFLHINLFHDSTNDFQ